MSDIKVGSVWTRQTSPNSRVSIDAVCGDRVIYSTVGGGVSGDCSIDDFVVFFREESVSANSTQVGGEHYKVMKIQPWDFIDANGLGYVEGMVIKYICRYRSKNGVEDLQKAKHAIDKLIERLQQESVV